MSRNLALIFDPIALVSKRKECLKSKPELLGMMIVLHSTWYNIQSSQLWENCKLGATWNIGRGKWMNRYNSVVHCRTLLKFGRLVHYGSAEAVEWLKPTWGRIQHGGQFTCLIFIYCFTSQISYQQRRRLVDRICPLRVNVWIRHERLYYNSTNQHSSDTVMSMLKHL